MLLKKVMISKQARSTFIGLTFTLLAGGATFFTQSIIAKSLSIENFGVFATLTSLLAFAAQIAVSGIDTNLYFDRTASQSRSPLLFTRYMWASCRRSLMVSIFFFFYLKHFFPELPYSIIYVCLGIFSYPVYSLLIGINRAESNFLKANFIQLLLPLMRLLTVFICIAYVYVYPISQSALNFLLALTPILVAIPMLYYSIDEASKERSAAKRIAKNTNQNFGKLTKSFPYFLDSINGYSHLTIIPIILFMILGKQQVSLFSAAAAIYTLFTYVQYILWQRFYETKIATISSRSFPRAMKWAKKISLKLILPIALSSLLVSTLFGRNMLIIFFGSNYESATIPLIILTSSLLPTSFSFSYNTLLNKRSLISIKSKFLTPITIISLGIAVFLISSQGVLGASLSVLLYSLIRLLCFHMLLLRIPDQ